MAVIEVAPKSEQQENTETEFETKYNLPKYACKMLERITDPQCQLDYKITMAKYLFKIDGAKKSGSNAFQNFDYFELKDILPKCTDICLRLGLNTHFATVGKKAVLTVTDVETGAKKRFAKPIPQSDNEKNINARLQSIGKQTTYLKRYCYMDFLDVVESDLVDSVDNEEKEPAKKPAPKKAPKKTNSKLLNAKGEYTLNGLKQHLAEKGISEKSEMKKVVNKLKLDKKLNQAVYNKIMSEIGE